MQKRAVILLLLALVMGAIAVFLVNTMLRQGGADQRAKAVSLKPVVVAAVDLKTGVRLDKLSLRTVEMPVESLPEGYYSMPETILGEKAPIVLKEIRKGEVGLPYKLSPQGTRGGLPPRIPEDKRAITISVNEITGVAGFVLPGNYVDVLFTTREGQTTKQPTTHTLLQNLLVLGVDQLSTEGEEKPKVVNAVTLLIDPNEGKMLTLAQEIGTLNLLLRNEFDASIVQDDLVTVRDILTEKAEPAAKTKVYKRVRRPVVEVIRGLEIQQQTVKEAQPQSDASDKPQAGTPKE